VGTVIPMGVTDTATIAAPFVTEARVMEATVPIRVFAMEGPGTRIDAWGNVKRNATLSSQ
jgi:hypothetical protein